MSHSAPSGTRPDLMPGDPAPNQPRDGFRWDTVEQSWLKGQPDGGMNLAWQCVDRHVAQGDGDRIALVAQRSSGRQSHWAYAELQRETQHFAAALHASGVALAERVCTLLPRRAELYIAALGTLRAGAVYAPLTTSLGPEPIRQRLTVGEARVLVTTRALYRENILPIRGALQTLQQIVLIDGDEAGAESWKRFLARAEQPEYLAWTGTEFPALLHFTSGTTGRPKGVLHVHRAGVAHLATSRLVLGLEPGSRFWCTADPGWVTGVTYGFLGPLLAGATIVSDEAGLDPERCYRFLRDEAITCWMTIPTELRTLLGAGRQALAGRTFPALQRLFTTGEPLDSHLCEWAQQTLGIPARDAWWQSETGAIMTAQYADRDVIPGRMGEPAPGIELALLTRDEDGALQAVHEPGVRGELAIRRGWPSMFRAYLGDSARYQAAFVDDWYLSGDLAEYDADGELRFISRIDDVIKASGHMIGPAEVEAVLNHHPDVAECAVAGVPDPEHGTRIAAWVVLREVDADPDVIASRLLEHARRRLGDPMTPAQLEFVDELPKTASGKLRRTVLIQESQNRSDSH